VAEIVVEFGSSQSIEALREAAYRLIPEASCQIEIVGEHHVCRLVSKAATANENELRCRFLDLVTDENLREKVARETAGIRDVIIALAFGALARERDKANLEET
jgi:His-Xaa-Ser system protein HxsD